MADGIALEVTNQAAWDGLLRDMTRDLGDLKAPLTEGGAALLASARAGAPHRTGAMAAAHSGSYTGRNRYTITVAHPGAAAVHWGWPGHGIRRQPWIVARSWHDTAWLERATAGVQTLLDTAAGKVK